MFHTAQPKRAQRRKMMQLVGVSEKDWFNEEELQQKVEDRSRRGAVVPFAQDDSFAEERTSIESLCQGCISKFSSVNAKANHHQLSLIKHS